jgi:hypothetical protein
MSELKYWAAAFLLMVIGSLLVGYPRLSHTPVFVAEFELCIFYLPTLILGLVCLRLAEKQTAKLRFSTKT